MKIPWSISHGIPWNPHSPWNFHAVWNRDRYRHAFAWGWSRHRVRSLVNGLKPRSHQQQCPSNIVECYKLKRFFRQCRMLLRYCCHFWQQCCRFRQQCRRFRQQCRSNIRLCRKDDVVSTKSNVASTMLLVWTGSYVFLYSGGGRISRCPALSWSVSTTCRLTFVLESGVVSPAFTQTPYYSQVRTGTKYYHSSFITLAASINEKHNITV